MPEYSEKVQDGGACPFCKRHYIDGYGESYFHERLTICSECYLFIGQKMPGYFIAKVRTAQNISVWDMRKSETIELMEQTFGRGFCSIPSGIKITWENIQELSESKGNK